MLRWVVLSVVGFDAVDTTALVHALEGLKTCVPIRVEDSYSEPIRSSMKNTTQLSIIDLLLAGKHSQISRDVIIRLSCLRYSRHRVHNLRPSEALLNGTKLSLMSLQVCLYRICGDTTAQLVVLSTIFRWHCCCIPGPFKNYVELRSVVDTIRCGASTAW